VVIYELQVERICRESSPVTDRRSTTVPRNKAMQFTSVSYRHCNN